MNLPPYLDPEIAEEDVPRDLACALGCGRPAWTESGYLFDRVATEGGVVTAPVCRRCWGELHPDLPSREREFRLHPSVRQLPPSLALEAHLRHVAAMMIEARRNRPTHYASYEHLVLERGQAWVPATLPRAIIPGLPRRCYDNTLELVRALPGLRYVEGFAVAAGSNLAVHHAWAVGPLGQVWDRTWWEDSVACGYWGIAFEWAEVERYNALGPDYLGILESEYLLKAPLLRTGRLFPTDAQQVSRTCPHCGRTSYHPDDVANAYCPCCGDDEALPKWCAHRPRRP